MPVPAGRVQIELVGGVHGRDPRARLHLVGVEPTRDVHEADDRRQLHGRALDDEGVVVQRADEPAEPHLGPPGRRVRKEECEVVAREADGVELPSDDATVIGRAGEAR
jgi:hypothetical protein